MMQERNARPGSGSAASAATASARADGDPSAGARARVGTRPLSARSVVASTLLGLSPPRLPAQVLVRAGELFGISRGATRTALSRMLAAGELRQERGDYHLAGRLLERHSRQRESRWPAPRRWDGTWVQAVVAPGSRSAADRTALRSAMRTLHLAELREGVWLRPDNLDPDRHPDAAAVVRAQCHRFRGTPDADDPATLAAGLWDLPAWAVAARGWLAELAGLQPALAAGDERAIAPGFVVSAAALRHLLADPLLPAELLPADWPAAELRARYDTYDEVFKEAWAAWFRRQLGSDES